MIIPCQRCGALNRVKEEPRGKARCGKCNEELPQLPAVLTIGEKSFDAIVAGADRPVIVDFWATWCGPCRMLAPTLEKFASRHPQVQFFKTDTDQNPLLSDRFQITMVPTLILFSAGREAKRISGILSLGDLEEQFKEWLPAAAASAHSS